MPFRAVHIGDLHFWSVPKNPMRYAGKRILGVGNLILRRARLFRTHHAPAIANRLLEIEPDWVIFSGDFSTTALAKEFRAARRVFSEVEQKIPGKFRAIPGNHDRYTKRSINKHAFEKHMAEWAPGGQWPTITDLGEGVWLFGLDATTSNGFLGSYGIAPSDQIDRLVEWGRENKDRVREVWLACHFPAEEPAEALLHDRGTQLYGAEYLLQALKTFEVPVRFLHGHHHYRWLYGSPDYANLTYLNAGAPMLNRPGPEPDLGFYQLDVDKETTRLTLHTCDIKTLAWSTVSVDFPVQGQYINLQLSAETLSKPIA